MIGITAETKNERFSAIKLHLTRKISTKLRIQSIGQQIRPIRKPFGNYLHRGITGKKEANHYASVYPSG
ncbi:hypothetical protein, partial [Aeromonas sp. A35_P]|uniref:hypothetical protein n=1 Tax=Aeromonas sp. A35_P TaxID=1983805 RepID=UPI001C3D185B